MKKNKLVILILSLFFVMLFSSCNMNFEETYTVWTDSGPYSEIEDSVNLDDGHFIYLELTNSEFKSMPRSDEFKHKWTTTRIKEWLIGRGFDDGQSTKMAFWFSTIDHGMLISRTGNVAYIMIK